MARTAKPSMDQKHTKVISIEPTRMLCFMICGEMRPNDPSSATAATGRVDCNRDDLPPFAAAPG
jgi:hypothetical protein